MKPIRRRDPSLTTTERGYGWQWQKLRLLILADEPLCSFCKARGLVVIAEEVDHIDGNSHNNDRDNLRPLCRPCHLARTAQDQAFGAHQWRPEWLRPSRVPLTIVCGAPASGKSTWVRDHAGDRDLVIDLDIIASRLSGQPPHAWDMEKWTTPAIRARNEMLGDLGRHANWPAAWLIISEAKPDNRQWWADKVQPKAIVVLETTPAECIARAKRDPDNRSIEKTTEAIGRWWSEYERRDGDTIVRPQQPTGGRSKSLGLLAS